MKRIQKVIITIRVMVASISITDATYREQLASFNIYSFVAFPQAQEELHNSCSTISIERAQKRERAILEAVNKLFDKDDDVNKRYKTKKLMLSIQGVIHDIPATNKDKRCEIQYLLISIMHYLRTTHLEIIYKNEMQYDFQNIEDRGKIEGINFKKNLLQQKYLQYKKYEDNFYQKDIHVQGYSNVQGDEQILATHLIRLTKAIVFKAIYELKQKHIRREEEIQDLLPKIIIDYHPGVCEDYHGKVKVNYLLRTDGSISNTEVQEIYIKINGCYKLFTLENIDQLIAKIVTHELGGHISHYLRDKKFKDFISICRKDIYTRNDQCTDNDFVSNYAQTNAYEDYAETFANRRLKLPIVTSPILQKKIDHMNNYSQQVKNY